MEDLTTAELAAVNAALILYRHNLDTSARHPENRPTEHERQLFANIVAAAESAGKKIAAALRDSAGTYR